MDRFVEQRVCCCGSGEALSLCVLVNICCFTSDSPWWAQLKPGNKQHIISLLESLKPSLVICHIIWNQMLVYMQQLRWAFCVTFCRTVCFIRSWRFALFHLLLRYPYICVKVTSCDRNTLKQITNGSEFP
jgi:hypothetical protein